LARSRRCERFAFEPLTASGNFVAFVSCSDSFSRVKPLAEPFRTETKMRLPQPLLLRVEFAFELERANHAIGQIVGPLKRQMWKCSHGKRSIAFVIITEETSLELVKRLRLDEISALEDYCCHVAPIGVICKHGGINTLHTAVTKAWEAVGQRRNPEYVRQTKRFDPRVERRIEDRERGAIREMRVEPSRVRNPPHDPDRK
jgi:hypothetical protein